MTFPLSSNRTHDTITNSEGSSQQQQNPTMMIRGMKRCNVYEIAIEQNKIFTSKLNKLRDEIENLRGDMMS